ncbi:MAG TPA: hypothetical protein VKB75_12575, partial [Jatrophihabitans sp.]|nr:hypothetical protein [Jatrophihabitans sp.]
VPHRLYASIEGWPKSTTEDHRAVLDALQRRSSQKSRSAMITHITNAGDLLAKHYESSPAGVAEKSAAGKVNGRSA